MKKYSKTDTVAYATSSGFAVVFGPNSSSSDAQPESSKPRPSAGKPVETGPQGPKAAKAS